MLNKEKATKTLSQVELERKTLSKWDGRDIKISSVADMELKFGILVIAHKIYSSIHLNNMSCEAVDLALKVVKNNMSFNLVELMLNQFNKNMESIRTSKNNPCNFGSILTYLFFFVQSIPKSKGYCHKCNMQGHTTQDYRSNVIRTQRFDGHCQNCKKYGHRAFECRSKPMWAPN